MKTRFLAPYPIFGRVKRRLSLAYQQRSPFYWWWAYLRQNEAYLKCCAAGGIGKYAALYADFGDVRSEDFKRWWSSNQRGARLFGEREFATKLSEIKNFEHVPQHWDTTKLMLVVVPLTSDKQYLKTRFNSLLKVRHTKQRGRIANKFAQSTAQYTLKQTYTIDNLDKCLAVYLRHKLAKQLGEKITLWRIGVELRLMPASIPKASDPPQEAFLKRQALAAAVSRYLKQANQRIANVALGVFP
jgi:hypothetical protein